jgi:protoheme IX farnesyltransferase
MPPVAYGTSYAAAHLLYTILLIIATLLPYLTGMCGLLYLAAAVILGGLSARYAIQLRRADAPAHLPMTVPLPTNPDAVVLAALLVDHYVNLRI